MAIPPGLRRLSWPGGLSARLLILTALFVMLAQLLILAPLLAAFEENWLAARVRAAELASLAVEAAPAGVVSDQLAGDLLEGAGVVLLAVQSDGRRRLQLAPVTPPATPPELVDLRRARGPGWLTAPFRTLSPRGGERIMRVVAQPVFRRGDFVEILVPAAPLRVELGRYLLQLLGVTLFIGVVAGVLVYLSLTVFLVRPMRRITESMERFRAAPEDPAVGVALSGRRDEIGRAEAELAQMQAELRAALKSRARLAALGEAVAKINHDLRNMLTGAQIASERLANSADPRVSKALPRLERALDRAVRLAGDVLTYGRSDEAAPVLQPLPLAAAAEMAAEDAGLTKGGVALETAMAADFTVSGDPDQLHRILVNLFRNAREAIEHPPEGAAPRKGLIRVTAETREGFAVVTVADNGSGVSERARERLFQPFGAGRAGGTGLGLTIARDLARGHGGELALAGTGPEGTTFELRLPAA